MVSPDHFAYNPQTAHSNLFQHQPKDEGKVTEQAVKEFNDMVKTLRDAGVNVEAVPSRTDIKTPDAVFPNNWFSTHMTSDGRSVLVIYPMLTQNRKDEVRIDLIKEKLEEKNGEEVYKVLDLSFYAKQGKVLEGTGVLILDRINHVVFVSTSPRTNIEVLFNFCKELNYRPIVFKSYDQNGKLIYHTNVMMSIGEDFAVIATDCIKDDIEREQVLAELKKLGKNVIKITPDQVNNMCGNVLELKTKDNNKVIVMSRTAYNHFTPEQRAELEKSGKIVPVDINTIEEVGGGSARCMLGEIF